MVYSRFTRVPAGTLYPLAIELAARHSATLGTRSLDLLHVARRR
ncbi:MAG: hypothetical protein R2843_15085 [Thermomicrobiales bacterium]